MWDLSVEVVVFLVAAAFLGGFIDAIAGGGGLITLPALLIGGMDPVTALSTNKAQGVFGSATAAISYARAGHVDLRKQGRAALVALLAGGAGAMVAGRIPTGLLEMILPVVLIAIALFFALKPGLSDADRVRSASPLAVFFVPLVACYDGLIGPGAGSFYMLGFVMLAGFGILKATAHTKLLNFSSNLGSLLVFAVIGTPLWSVGLVMGAAAVVGARMGSRLAMRIGARVIRPLLVVTSTAMALRLIWQMF
ncbi:TSUP family transporter [Falsirhodobacter deserti]|uniref:TSUP family transporter n=1 Tax=Falsirhodobacter deserti TaxID=1365611 RepID=UPI000FE31B0E|nr:TSUP family transporter [Falsirhodobacter deserti]